VFCEKPFTLNPQDADALSALANERNLVTQVGYHNRFIGAFQEVKRLLDAGAIGEVTHVLGEAYGPVVLKPKGGTWRSQRTEGGGCLYDYAAHVLDLVNWYVGEPLGVGGTALNNVFSREIDDEVFGTLYYPQGTTAQISVNWSDESYRKMTTRITVWGKKGRIFVDRQECQVYIRDTATPPVGYEHGWNVRYTTELTEPVWFYLRGEEYSAQIDAFVQRVKERRTDGVNRFDSAGVTDRIIGMLVADAEKGASTPIDEAIAPPVSPKRSKRSRLWRR
jgi:predicted dehydrogenase